MSGLREQKREEQRTRILDAARDLFAARGPDEVTVAEVASAAGVARATVFNHFGSKHALVEALTEDVLGGYQAILRNALADKQTPTVVLVRTLFEVMGRGIEEDRRFYRGVFREISKLMLGLDEGGPGQRARQSNLQGVLQLLTRGQARGELSSEHTSEDLAFAFDSLVFGTITHWLYDDASEALHDRMLRAAEIFLAPVALDAESQREHPTPDLAPHERSRERSRSIANARARTQAAQSQKITRRQRR
jgi:AcrR family transcriptional regulator